ncbi:MAG: rhamnan synthesis F family protein [Pseudomonadota bacterium]
MTRRIAILAQYDPDGGVPAHVRVHLEGLRDVVDRLILVSNSPINPEAKEAIGSVCDRVVARKNIGWDFAGWRDVIASEDITPFDWVILTNSSVIGPLYPLEPILEKMEASGKDFWGIGLLPVSWTPR